MSSRLRSSTGAIARQRALACICRRSHPLSPQCDQQDLRVLLLTLRSSRLCASGFRCCRRAPTPRERLRRNSQADMYTYTVSHVGSHAGRGQARRLHARTAAHHHQARRLHGGRTHTSDRHTQDTQDGRRATTHSACTCRWTSVKHRVGWVGITEASAACAHTEPSSSLQSEHKSDRKQRAFACTSKRFHPLSPHCDHSRIRRVLLRLDSGSLPG